MSSSILIIVNTVIIEVRISCTQHGLVQINLVPICSNSKHFRRIQRIKLQSAKRSEHKTKNMFLHLKYFLAVASIKKYCFCTPINCQSFYIKSRYVYNAWDHVSGLVWEIVVVYLLLTRVVVGRRYSLLSESQSLWAAWTVQHHGQLSRSGNSKTKAGRHDFGTTLKIHIRPAVSFEKS